MEQELISLKSAHSKLKIIFIEKGSELFNAIRKAEFYERETNKLRYKLNEIRKQQVYSKQKGKNDKEQSKATVVSYNNDFTHFDQESNIKLYSKKTDERAVKNECKQWKNISSDKKAKIIETIHTLENNENNLEEIFEEISEECDKESMTSSDDETTSRTNTEHSYAMSF